MVVDSPSNDAETLTRIALADPRIERLKARNLRNGRVIDPLRRLINDKWLEKRDQGPGAHKAGLPSQFYFRTISIMNRYYFTLIPCTTNFVEKLQLFVHLPNRYYAIAAVKISIVASAALDKSSGN
jgi:hypothetical protein